MTVTADTVTDDDICRLINTILICDGDLTVSDSNILRDCEIARGFTSAKLETEREAKARVCRAINARAQEAK